MRFLTKSHTYKKDFQREGAGKYRLALAVELPNVIAMLAADQPLPDKYCDHMLTGDWAGYRECHIRPDLLLIYMKIGDSTGAEEPSGELHLARLGSHSELF
jgi:mRNA interferase YafQ